MARVRLYPKIDDTAVQSFDAKNNNRLLLNYFTINVIICYVFGVSFLHISILFQCFIIYIAGRRIQLSSTKILLAHAVKFESLL